MSCASFIFAQQLVDCLTRPLGGVRALVSMEITENYFDFTARPMFWIGMCFELPLILMFLAKLKFVSSRQLEQGS